jgi:Flp pilus assembly pilin Flp
MNLTPMFVCIQMICTRTTRKLLSRSDRDPTRESGQASVEYALVLLGAAILASLLIAWASRTSLLDDLFDFVMSLIKGKAGG